MDKVQIGFIFDTNHDLAYVELSAPLSAVKIIAYSYGLNTKTGRFDVTALSAGELGNSLLET